MIFGITGNQLDFSSNKVDLNIVLAKIWHLNT